MIDVVRRAERSLCGYCTESPDLKDRSGSIRADWLANLDCCKQSCDSTGTEADSRYRRDRPRAGISLLEPLPRKAAA